MERKKEKRKKKKERKKEKERSRQSLPCPLFCWDANRKYWSPNRRTFQHKYNPPSHKHIINSNNRTVRLWAIFFNHEITNKQFCNFIYFHVNFLVNFLPSAKSFFWTVFALSYKIEQSRKIIVEESKNTKSGLIRDRKCRVSTSTAIRKSISHIGVGGNKNICGDSVFQRTAAHDLLFSNRFPALLQY